MRARRAGEAHRRRAMSALARAEDGADHPLGRARRLVEVDLLEHEEAREDERLDRGKALGAVDREAGRLGLARGRREAQAAEEPVEIEDAVAHAGRVRVAEEVVAAIDVERAAHGAWRGTAAGARRARARRRARACAGSTPTSTWCTPVDGSRTMRSVHSSWCGVPGIASSKRCESGPCPTSWRNAAASASCARSLVTCCQNGSSPWICAEAREEQLHHVRRADRVREARVLGAGKRERRDAELPDAAEALHLRRVHEARDDALLVGLERDEAVHGVAEDHARASAICGRRRAPSSPPDAHRETRTGRASTDVASRGARRRPRAGRALGVPRARETAPSLRARADRPGERLARRDERRRARASRLDASTRRRARASARAARRRRTRSTASGAPVAQEPRARRRDRDRRSRRRGSRAARARARRSPVVPLPGEEIDDEPARAASRTR